MDDGIVEGGLLVEDGTLEVGGGVSVVVVGSGLELLSTLVGVDDVSTGGIVVEISVETSVEASVDVSGAIVVELSPPSRFASRRIALARGASAWWTASMAWFSDGHTPSWNWLGKYRWRSSWRDEGEADFSRAENEDGSGVPVVVWLAGDPPWQGALSVREEPAEATPKRTSRHSVETRIIRRAYAILLTDAGRCGLVRGKFVPEAVFSSVTTGRRVSE